MESYQLRQSIPSICPRSPFIPFSYSNNPEESEDERTQDKLSGVVKVIAKHQAERRLGPKIIKAQPRSKSYQMMEHQRELRSLKKRLSECKNWQQRKKDKYDPLVYPIYLIRDPSQLPNYHTHEFYHKIMNQTTYKKSILQNIPTHSNSKQQTNKQKFPRLVSKQKKHKYTKSVDEWSTEEKYENRPLPLNLPLCSAKSIMNHILQERIFHEQELRILKSRMIHYYGKKVIGPWSMVINALNE